MSKREKIIVALMAVAVLYGVYALFFEGKMAAKKGAPAKSTPASIEGFIGEIAAKLTTMKESDSGRYALARAEAAWETDPFLETEINTQSPSEAQNEEPADVENLFVYTGYLKMGKRGMAIVNGMEYEVGDVIEGAGYTIKRITPTQVVIGMPDSKKEFVLLLAETE